MSGKHSRKNSTKALAVALSAGLAVIVTAGTAIAGSYKEVTVNIDGETHRVNTWARDVSSVLDNLESTICPEDSVEPARNATINNGQTINVSLAREYTQKVGGEDKAVKSAAPTVSQVVNGLSEKGESATVAIARTDELALPIGNKTSPVTVQHDGKTTKATAAPGKDIKTVLAEAKVPLSPLDRTTVTTEDGQMLVRVTRINRVMEEVDTVTKKHPTKEVKDDNLYKGEKKIVTEGKDEITSVKQYVVKENGKVTHEVKLSETVKQKAVEEVVHIGTKEKEEATDTTAAGVARPGKGTGSAPAGSVWAALAQCESGGNPATNTGNGFYGMYQFTIPTWRAVGGTGLPSDASAAEQTKRAQILQQRAGWGQWPACTSRLGLR